MPLEMKPTVDFVFKKIFGQPDHVVTLIGLLNAVLVLPEPIQGLVIKNPFSEKDFRESKQIILDVKAIDTSRRHLTLEMQTSTHARLMERMAYYASGVYFQQITQGEDYTTLQPVRTICLLNKVLFADTPRSHFCFELIDQVSEYKIEKGIAVHLIELPKYNLEELTIASASALDQWVYFLTRAHLYDAVRLRELLTADGLPQAISILERIAAREEDRKMYDERAERELDFERTRSSDIKVSLQKGMQQGRQEGRQEGMQEGVAIGQIQLLQKLLGETPSSAVEFANLTFDELQRRVLDLETRFQNRSN